MPHFLRVNVCFFFGGEGWLIDCNLSLISQDCFQLLWIAFSLNLRQPSPKNYLLFYLFHILSLVSPNFPSFPPPFPTSFSRHLTVKFTLDLLRYTSVAACSRGLYTPLPVPYTPLPHTISQRVGKRIMFRTAAMIFLSSSSYFVFFISFCISLSNISPEAFIPEAFLSNLMTQMFFF